MDPVVEEKQGNGSEVTAEKPETGNVKKTKQNVMRTKQVTVPHPFSLATEKRMARERKVSVGLPSPPAKPKLSKSSSFNCKAGSSSEKAGEISEPKTSSKLKGPTAPAKIEASKNSQVTSNKVCNLQKQMEADKEMKKLGKSSTFKASPLPSFYSRKVPPPTRPELKKATVTQPKPPSVGQRSKVVASASKNKVEHKGKVCSKPITKEKMSTMLDVPTQTVETVVATTILV